MKIDNIYKIATNCFMLMSFQVIIIYILLDLTLLKNIILLTYLLKKIDRHGN